MGCIDYFFIIFLIYFTVDWVYLKWITRSYRQVVIFLSLISAIILFNKISFWNWKFLLLLGLTVMTAMSYFRQVRYLLLTQPLLRYFKKTMPTISPTERVALYAGGVFWEADLMSGNPSWDKLFSLPVPRLTAEEQAFLDERVEELCRQINDWDMYLKNQMPQELWDWIRQHGFLGMIIPKEYGGLGFSAYAHSCVVARIASRSMATAVSVMVPNSLGPAELLLHYGTMEQKKYYLPRLAQGEEIPCFALTGVESGSDAASMQDKGIITYGEYQGKTVLGARLTWNKRYITLAPIATLLGLAIDVYDPEHLCGEHDHVGITLFLIPANYPGVQIGSRHQPMNLPFMNGPTTGENVFVPLDLIIGGRDMLGHGWRMLMECLSIGRSISLPALSAAMTSLAYKTTGAYARIRKQFQMSIGHMEGVQEEMAKIAGLTYIVQAARCLTAQAVDLGIKPSVASAIAKYHMTEMARTVLNSSMDIHAGRAIQLGPNNYLGMAYIGAPIAITVEGSNILTRNLIIFGQGSVRCHPFLRREIELANVETTPGILAEFDHLVCQHVKHVFTLLSHSIWHGLTFGTFIGAPSKPHLRKYCKKLTHLSLRLALLTEFSFLILGGSLKRRERLSARLGDALSHLYLASGVIKQFNELNDIHESEVAHLDWSMQYCMDQCKRSMLDFLRNVPSKILAGLVRWILFPWGLCLKKPSDELEEKLALLMQKDDSVRTRLAKLCYSGSHDGNPTDLVERAWKAQVEIEPFEQSFYRALKSKGFARPKSLDKAWKLAREHELLSEAQIQQWMHAEQLRIAALQVDEFIEGK